MGRIRPKMLNDDAPPRVSVVIPCYNYARFLPAAVESALGQEGVDVDVVIIDDASTDDSAEVAERLARDRRVTFVRHARNRGHVETSNEALACATGVYVVKLDADDLLTPGSLARSTALMERHPEVVLCYGLPEAFRGNPPTATPDRVRSWSIWQGEDWIGRVLRRGHNVIMQPEVLLRRDAVVASGGYRSELRWAEDYNWWLRLATVGAVGRVNGPTQGLYRVHELSLQRSVENIELTDLRARIEAVEMFLAECEQELSSPNRIRRLGLSSLAREARMQAAQSAQTGSHDVATYEEIAAGLDAMAGDAPRYSISANRTIIGSVYRDLLWRVRSRRWERFGY